MKTMFINKLKITIICLIFISLIFPFVSHAFSLRVLRGNITNVINSYCARLLNMFNGTRTDGGFPGGSQANGGVDDYNNGKAATADTYYCPSGWTTCASGNNWCGVGTPDGGGAKVKDNCSGLVWSYACKNAGCSSLTTDTSPTTYYWTATDDVTKNNNLSAQQLCSAGSHGLSGWSLPHQKQLMQAYIDGSYKYLEGTGVNRYYWSATTRSGYTSDAWLPNLSYGSTYYSTKATYTYYVRCVRSAN